MRNKILAIMLCITLTVSMLFTACGSTETGTEEPKQEEQKPEEPKVEESEPEKTEEPEEPTPEPDKPLDIEVNVKLKYIMEILADIEDGGFTEGFDFDLSFIYDLYALEDYTITALIYNIHNEYGEPEGGRTEADGALFSVKQVENIIGSLVGHEVDLSLLANEDGWIETDLRTDVLYTDCKNWNTEYMGNNTWKVYTDVNAFSADGDGYYKIAEMIFTVIENPDSIFDGYSITGVEATPPKMSEWAKAYYDYLVEGNLDRDFYYEAEGYSFCLCYIDEDEMPELYVNAGLLCGYALYTYYNGEVVQLFESSGTNYIDWIERSGKVLYAQGGSAMYAECVWIYEMVNGELQQIAEGELITQDYIDFYEGDLPPSTWNGKDVTEDEYQVLKNEVFDTSEAIDFGNEKNDVLGLYPLLNMLSSR